MGALVKAARTDADGAPGPFWAAPICHPLPLLVVLAMAINDHWLKASGLLPELVTGKLSDLCGLFFFPALLVALLRGTLHLRRGRPVPLGRIWSPLAVAATGAGFAAANLSAPFNHWLGTWWGYKMMDPTDLLALPALALSWLWLRRCDDCDDTDP